MLYLTMNILKYENHTYVETVWGIKVALPRSEVYCLVVVGNGPTGGSEKKKFFWKAGKAACLS